MADTFQYHHHQLVLHQHHLSHHHQQQQQEEAPAQAPPQRSRLGGGLRTTPGEIVEVQGGHIVRSTGRKDRHSKVCTAKGPRDRRVRLSAHTAIQFYDVQDRLGYDRPSKAVDWLIQNAKAAIDELAELPAWHPTSSSSVPPPPPPPLQEPVAVNSSKEPIATTAAGSEPAGASSHYGYGGSSSFVPPSLESDSIVDTIKSFFPTAAASSSTVPSPTQPQLGYQNYPSNLLSRTSSHSQNLRLSLHSLQQQDPIYHHTQSGHHAPFSSDPHNVAYAAAAASMPQWNVADASGSGGSGGRGGEGGFMFSVPPPPQALPLHSMMLGQGQFFTQRGPLQSSYPPFARPWADPIPASASEPQQQHSMHIFHPSSVVQSISFAPSGSSSGFSGFRIPASIQGGEEEHDGASDKPASASSGSRH